MPKITLLNRTNLQECYWHSTLLSLLRGLAALQVAAAHLRAAMFPGFGAVEKPPLAFQGLAFCTGFAYLAVIVFFVLSGWLVGGSFLNKLNSDRPFLHYAVDRVSRLWVVLIPMLLVGLLVGAIVGALDLGRISFSANEPYSVSALIGNMFGLQTILVLPFGGNFPLWSLANEVWYYAMFPLLVLAFRADLIRARFVAVLTLVAIASVVHETIMLYFSLWLLGAAFSRVKIEVGAAWRWVLLLVLVASAIYVRMRGRGEITTATYLQYLVFSLLFVLFLSSMQFMRECRPTVEWLDGTGRFFASFSFTLYVLHVPTIALARRVISSLLGIGQLSPYRLSHYLLYAITYLVLVAGAYCFYLPFESKTQQVRQWIKVQLFGRAAAVTT